MPQGRAAPRRLVKGAKAKNKSTKGAGAARRAIRRDTPALKLIADSSDNLLVGWEACGGDPLKWRFKPLGTTDDTDELQVCEDGHREICSVVRARRRRTCDVCGAFAGHNQPSFPVCGACGKRRYCGEACQIADWEAGHARKCGR